VIVWDVYGATDHRPGWLGAVRDARPVRWWQRSGWGSKLYHGLGLCLWLTRRGLPRAIELLRVAKRRNVRLIHTNIRIGHDREGILAAWLGRLPCVCHIRHQETLGCFDRLLARTVSRFIYISQAVRESHLKSGVPAGKGRIVYNGLNIAAFTAGLDTERGRAILGQSLKTQVVGMVGRLDTWKGHEVFLRAMAILRQTHPAVKAVIVGDPPPDRSNYRRQLELLSEELHLDDVVSFLPFQADVPAVMSALDVLVLASTSPEPFGRVIIEAMAAGKPVIAVDSGAAREILEDGQQGLLVDAGDDVALARAAARLLSDSDLAQSMGRLARLRVAERFGADRYLAGVQATYREILESPSVVARD